MTMTKGIHGWIVTATGLTADRVRWARQGKAVPRPTTPGPWISIREIGVEAGGPDWTERAAYPLTFADLAIATVDAGADTLTVTAHSRTTGDGPVRIETTGTAPGGAAIATDYWLIAVDANTLQLAASFVDAMDGVSIGLTDAGAGSHAIASTDDTRRAHAELIATTAGTRTATISIQAYAGEPTDSTGTTAMGYLDRIRAAAALDGVREAMRAEGVAIAVIGQSRDLSVALAGGDFENRAVLEARVHVDAPHLTETMTIIETVTATGSVT